MANLSWGILQETLNSLAQQGFLLEVDVSGKGDKRSSKVYDITPKGIKLLKIVRDANQLIDGNTPLINNLKIF
jgi:predicted transcriptional regulator